MSDEIKIIAAVDDEDGSSYNIGDIVKFKNKKWKVKAKKFIAVGNTWSEYEYTLLKVEE